MAKLSLSNADCAVLVFSFTDKVHLYQIIFPKNFSIFSPIFQNSFEEVSRLREAITEEFSELPLIIIGNKLDLGLWIFQENISTSSKGILLFYFDTYTKENIFSETSFNYKDEF